MVIRLNLVDKDELMIDSRTACCFTGHRKRDLPFCGDLTKQGMKNLVSTVHLKCVEAYERGIRTFIAGMAEGADLMCGSVIMDMKGDSRYKDIRLICVLPYPEQRKELRSAPDRYIHSLMLESADAVTITGEIADPGRYRKRNQYMVDHSSALIAVYREKQCGSGTLQTINMARRAGSDIHIIDLDRNPQFYIE